MSSVTDHNMTHGDRLSMQKSIVSAIPSYEPATLRTVLSFLKEKNIDGPSEVPKILQVITDDGLPILHRAYQGISKDYEKAQEVVNILTAYGAKPIQRDSEGRSFFEFKTHEDTNNLFQFQKSLMKAIFTQKPSRVHDLIFNHGSHFQELGLSYLSDICRDKDYIKNLPLINRMVNISQTYQCNLSDSIIAINQNHLLSRSKSLLHQAISHAQRENIPEKHTTLNEKNDAKENYLDPISNSYPAKKPEQKVYNTLRTLVPRALSPLSNQNLL